VVVYTPEEIDANSKRWSTIFQDIFR
jgi:hypothetical protein